MVFCNKGIYKNMYVIRKNVTILILIDGFLQFIDEIDEEEDSSSQSLF